jgi:hypothetical protein
VLGIVIKVRAQHGHITQKRELFKYLRVRPTPSSLSSVVIETILFYRALMALRASFLPSFLNPFKIVLKYYA